MSVTKLGALMAAAASVIVMAGMLRATPVNAQSAAAVSAPLSSSSSRGGVLDVYERRQRDAAQAAQREGRFAAATWHWEVLLAVQPGDAQALRGRALAKAAAAAQASDRHAKARAARQQGDVDEAVRLYLEVLALEPDPSAAGHESAADALREIEHARTRRGHVHALPLMRAAEARARAAQASRAGSPRNEAEYETLFATPVPQDGAAQTPAPASGTRATVRRP